MNQANYKSTRLLVEAINKEVEALRKSLMAAEPDKIQPDARGDVFAPTLALRSLVDQLAKKAERVALEDLTGMAETDPAEYVAAMMPFVAEYHRLLAPRDLLAPCLCRDLRVGAVVVILVGDGSSTVRTAHDPSKPEAALVVEALLASLDSGAKQATNARVEELAGAAPLDAAALEGETFAGIDRQVGEPVRYESTPLTVETLEAGMKATLRSPEVALCSGCDCEAGACDCVGCEGFVERAL